MNSNVKFESNVYPVSGRASTDKEFLSKIWDYSRIATLDKRYSSNIPWTSLQRKILVEQPTCSLNKADPCWGMVKTADGHIWVSMCTKTECGRFSNCRAKRPYNPVAEADFVPMEKDVEDEFGYEAFRTEYFAYPVLVGEQIEFESDIAEKDSISVESPEVAFGELIHIVNEIDVADSAGDEKQVTEIVYEEQAISETANNQNENEEETKVPPVFETDDKIDIHDPNINVFDYFVSATQEEIITASAKDCFFVDAGPGTGKTYTLIQKLNHLVCQENVEADGILVLCFTNAAVDEVKMRLRQFVASGADRSLVNVDVRTFHSFAWWLINQANSVLCSEGWNPVSLQSLSYETSLMRACDVVGRFGEKVVGNWEYFIVDEVQDLTNTLGRFVLRIVDACLSVQCGVTVLGDACQAIYDYDHETRSVPLKSGEFYKALFRKMYGKAKYVFLTENHRQGSDLIGLTSGLRTAILSDDVTQMNTAVNEFKSAVETSTASGAAISEAYLEELRSGGSVSLLLRNNGQTLKMSSDLRKRGIAHTLNVSETSNNFAAWIADIFGNYHKSSISEDKFIDLYEEVVGEDGEEVWRRLQRLLHTDNDVLDVKNLLNAIAVCKIDDSVLRSVRERKVVVSNIHRSKGREYDCVLVDKSFVDSFSTETPGDEYKTLYVAITRPRKRVLLAPLHNKAGMKVIKFFSTGRSRWGNTKNKKISYLELDCTKDIGCDCYASTSPSAFVDIAVGDAVYLKRILSPQGVEYKIIHENSETVIGIIPERSNYIQDLMAYMKVDCKSLIELPSVISDIYVSGVYAQVVDDKYLEIHPTVKAEAPNGVWKWVDLVGIGHAEYDVY